ncbi:hypothetical protein [Kordia jejudonensis]|uniref:hypothetical protein n=1 Tax=Kordia jejudonensis TaxID=1348245 RepID=UPI0006290F33|nr:hypothetical protein [Kordia jejudonensis]
MKKIEGVDRILKFLKISFDAKSKMDYKRLEILYNSKLLLGDNEKINYVLGKDFLNLLNKSKENELIEFNSEFGYSITQKGIDFLEENKT